MSTVLVTKQQPKKKPSPKPQSRFTSAFVTVSAPARPSRKTNHRRRKNNKSPDALDAQQIPPLVEKPPSNPKTIPNTLIRPNPAPNAQPLPALTKAPIISQNNSQPAWRRPRINPPDRPSAQSQSQSSQSQSDKTPQSQSRYVREKHKPSARNIAPSRYGASRSTTPSKIAPTRPTKVASKPSGSGRYQRPNKAIAYDPSEIDMAVKSSPPSPFERNIHGMRPLGKARTARLPSASLSRGGMARYNSVGRQGSPLSSSTSTHSASSAKSVKSNSPLSPQSSVQSIPSNSSPGSASPAPGLKRHVPNEQSMAKVAELEAELASLKSKLAAQESACASTSCALSALQVQHDALRTSYEWQVSANESIKAELEALRKKHTKKTAECKALEQALLCVANAQNAKTQSQQKVVVDEVSAPGGVGDGEEASQSSVSSQSASAPSVSVVNDQKEGVHVSELNYRAWRYDAVFRWIASIDGGYFCKYEELYEKLKMLNIDGRCLEKMNEAVVGRIGVAELQDKLYLMQHIHSLVQRNQ